MFIQLLLSVLVDEIALEHGLILLARRRNDLGSLLLRSLAWRCAVLALGSTGQRLLFLVGIGIMTQALIDHITIDVGVGFKTTTIGRVAQTVRFLLNMDSLFSALLTDFLYLFDLVSLLEVTVLNLLNSAFILLLKLVQLVHPHIHDVFFSSRVGDHHA